MTEGKERMRAFPMTLDQEHANEILAELKISIQACLEGKPSKSSYEDDYRKAYILTLRKYGTFAYDGLKDSLLTHLTEKVKPSIIKSIQDEHLLTIMPEAWKKLETSVVEIRDIFMYIDRVHVQQNKLEPILSIGKSSFKQQILLDEVIKKALKTAMDRVHKSKVDEIQNALKMIEDVGAKEEYKEYFAGSDLDS